MAARRRLNISGISISQVEVEKYGFRLEEFRDDEDDDYLAWVDSNDNKLSIREILTQLNEILRTPETTIVEYEDAFLRVSYEDLRKIKNCHSSTLHSRDRVLFLGDYAILLSEWAKL